MAARDRCGYCRNNVAYGNGMWLDFGRYCQRASTDTIHWSLRTTARSNMEPFEVKYRCGEFFALDRDTSSTCVHLQKSTDTIHWETPGNLNDSRSMCGSYKFVTGIEMINNGKKYLVGGDCAHFSSSTDFVNWKTCKICDNKLWRNCCCTFDYCFYSLHKSNLTDYPNRYFTSGYGYNTLSMADITTTGIAGAGGAASSSFLYNVSLENVSKKEGLTVCIGSGGQGGGTVWLDTEDLGYPTEWKIRTAVAFGSKIYDLTFNDGKFVAVGEGRLVTVSTDSIVWSLRTVGEVSSACDYRSVIYDCNHWLVAGHTNAANGSFGSLSASTDTIHWTQRTTGIVDDHRQIIYNDVKKTYFLNSIGCAAASSTDAVNWTLRTIGLSSCATQCGFLSWSGDYYVVSAAGASGAGQGGTLIQKALSVSTDAIHWTARTIGNTDATVMAHGYIHPNYVAYLWCHTVSTSTDTIHWTKRTATNRTCNNCDRANPNIMPYLNGELFLLNDRSENRSTSTTDGIHWVCRNSPNTTACSCFYRTLAYGNGKYVASTSTYDNSDVCVSAFDAGATSGCDTFVRWYNGFPANARGSVYPLDITSTGGNPPTAASASYCFDPVGSEAAVLEYKSTDFRLSNTDTTEVGNFTVEFWYRVKGDASNPALQTLFALGESTENGFLSIKYDATSALFVIIIKILQEHCKVNLLLLLHVILGIMSHLNTILLPVASVDMRTGQEIRRIMLVLINQ